MNEADTNWNPFLLIFRGLCWGAGGGGMLGVLVVIPIGLLAVAGAGGTSEIAAVLAFVTLAGVIAGAVGVVVGAALGLAGGLALALSGPRGVRRMYRARLITGGAAAAVPLVKAHFFSQAWGLDLGYPAAAILAVLGACAAVLLTPLVVHGWPDRRERLPAGAHEPAGRGNDLSAPGAPDPRWLIVGRAMSWGVIGGAALGALCWTVLRLGSDRFASMEMVWLALGGAVLGAVLGMVGGLAAPLSASKGEQSSARLG